jgi:hypothetical protein
MPPISLGWKTVQEQIVSSCALVLETRKADCDCLIEELEIVPDKIAAEDKYVVDHPIRAPKMNLISSATLQPKQLEHLKD